LLMSAAPFFLRRGAEIVSLAARYRLPTMYPWREYCEIGGLMSYGCELAEGYYQVGSYIGKILSGAKPRDLPVQLPTKFDLVLNLRTAKDLGLAIPRVLNARAASVIE